jgi:hypothetical protein
MKQTYSSMSEKEVVAKEDFVLEHQKTLELLQHAIESNGMHAKRRLLH